MKRQEIRERPENQIADAKIHHWNQVFKYQRDRMHDDNLQYFKELYKSPNKNRMNPDRQSYASVKLAAQNDLSDL